MKKKLLIISLILVCFFILSFLIGKVYAIDTDLSNLTDTTGVIIEIDGVSYEINNTNDVKGLLSLKDAIDDYRKSKELNSYESLYEEIVDVLANYANSISASDINDTIYYYSGEFYTDIEHTNIFYNNEGVSFSNMEEVINNASNSLVISLLTEYRVAKSENWTPSVDVILFRGDSDGKRFIEVNQNLTLTMQPTETGSLTIDGYGSKIRTTYTPIRASRGSTINIYDGVIIKEFYCTTNGGVMYLDGGTINIYGGIFYHNTAGATGGFISCTNGDFNVYDGIFVNNVSVTGGGVFTLKYVSSAGEVNFTGGVFANNETSRDGGVIWLQSGTLNASNVVIYGNTAKTNGGVISMTSGNIVLENSLIYDNTATNNGGMAYIAGGNFKMNSGYLGIESDDLNNARGNISKTGAGGALYISEGSVTINGGYLSNNVSSTSNGGGIYTTGGSFIMNDGIINKNTAVNGGGVFVNGGNITVNKGDIIDNEAQESGGGLYANSTSKIEINILGGNIKNNKALVSGGGIEMIVSSTETSVLNIGSSSVSLSENVLDISNNFATNNGGGMNINGNVIVNVNNGLIYENETTGTGGGINVTAHGEVNVYGGIIENNTSSSHGAGVNIGSNGKFMMEGGEIKNNHSSLNGGGVYLDSGTYTMTNGSIANNEALNGGGAYVNSANFNLNGGNFSNNIAQNNGGGFYIGDNSKVELLDGIIENNVAINGGGFYQTQFDNQTITNIGGNCVIDNNQAINGNGGGVYIDGGSIFRMIGGKITYNKATYSSSLTEIILAKDSNVGVGGGVYILKGTFTMYDEEGNQGTAAIFGNTADYAADDLFASGVNTSFDAISVIDMIKDDVYKTADSWFEDFPLNEEHTSLNYEKRNDNDSSNDIVVSKGRYKNIVNDDDKSVATTVLYRNCTDYIAITMGRSIGDIQILITNNNIKEAHSFIYQIESCSDSLCNDASPEIMLNVVAYKNNPAYVSNLPSGIYKVSLVSSWSWRYKDDVIFKVTENSHVKEQETSSSVIVNVYTEQITSINTDYSIINKKWLSKVVLDMSD